MFSRMNVDSDRSARSWEKLVLVGGCLRRPSRPLERWLNTDDCRPVLMSLMM
jgi:hypothetical protein